MKKTQLFAILSMLLFFCACSNKETIKKAVEYESTGIIYGLDEATCACCGNWLIALDGSQDRVQFVALPEASLIDLGNAIFPIDVKLNWRPDESFACPYSMPHIIIEDIQLD